MIGFVETSGLLNVIAVDLYVLFYKLLLACYVAWCHPALIFLYCNAQIGSTRGPAFAPQLQHFQVAILAEISTQPFAYWQ